MAQKLWNVILEREGKNQPSEPLIPPVLRYNEAGIALGNATIAIRHCTFLFGSSPDKAKQILMSVVERGFATSEVCGTLGNFCLQTLINNNKNVNHKNHEDSGIEAVKWFQMASECQPTYQEDETPVEDAQESIAFVYAIGSPRIPADPVYACYLTHELFRTCEKGDPLVIARMYRFGFWFDLDWTEAVRYYAVVLTKPELSSFYSNKVMEEAKEFLQINYRNDINRYQHSKGTDIDDMYLRNGCCSQCDERIALIDMERRRRLNYLLASINLHPGIPDVYSHIVDHYIELYMRAENVAKLKGGSKPKDMETYLKKAKVYLDKGVAYLPSKKSINDIRLLCSCVRYYLLVGEVNNALQYLPKLEALVDVPPTDDRLRINILLLDAYNKMFTNREINLNINGKRLSEGDILQLKLKVLDRLIRDGDFAYLRIKAETYRYMLDSGNYPHINAHIVYDCFIDIEKSLSKDVKNYKEELQVTYYDIGVVHLYGMAHFGKNKTDRRLDYLLMDFEEDKVKDKDTAKHASETEDNKTRPYLPRDREKARLYFKKSIALGGTYAWLYLGRTYSSFRIPWERVESDYEMAAKCYLKHIDLNPNFNKECYLELAYIKYLRKGDTQGGNEFMREAVAKSADMRGALRDLGTSLLGGDLARDLAKYKDVKK